MEIPRGKEGMKAAKFNNTIGATAGCTVRLLWIVSLLNVKERSMGYEEMPGMVV
jgi:hypothetical protein